MASLIAVAAILIPGCPLPAIHSEMQSVDTEVWRTDLRNSNHNWDDFHTPAFFQATRQIAFGSSAELVVAKDSGPFAKPNEVHGFVLDTKSGKLLREAHWTSGSWPFLFATSNGKYAVVTEAGMALYSQGLQSAIATGVHTADKVSPDGRYLSASESIPGHGVTVFIDAETLKPNGTQFQDVYAWSIADNRVASSAWRGEQGAGDPPSLSLERVTVFDVNQRKPVFATDVSDLKGSTIGASSGVALSPDGSSLAINSAGVVRLFALQVQ
jgi:hypothetical protein